MYTRVIATACVCTVVFLGALSASALDGPEATPDPTPAPPAGAQPPYLPILPDPLDCDAAMALAQGLEAIRSVLINQIVALMSEHANVYHELAAKDALYNEHCTANPLPQQLVGPCGVLNDARMALLNQMSDLIDQIDAKNAELDALEAYLSDLNARIAAQCLSE